MAVVVVADDHPGVRKAVCAVLESRKKCEKCVEAADGSLDLDIFPIITTQGAECDRPHAATRNRERPKNNLHERL
jgi:hypothetical protein